MDIIKKLKEKQENPNTSPAICVAFLGDSITQGCFEIYRDENGKLKTVNDYENVYHNKFRQIMSKLYPDAPVSIINAGISGNSSWEALSRIERDVIRHSPDLCVVSFGANDANSDGGKNIDKFYDSLMEIAKKLKENNIEVIFMSTAMNCTKLNPELKDEGFRKIAENVCNTQNFGTLKKFMQTMEKAAKDSGVVFCDCYTKWETLYKNGVDTDSFLCNHINHPSRELHSLFANSLVETIFHI